MSRVHVAKNIQILIFYFSCYYFMLSGNFLRLVNAGMGFFEVNFWSRDLFWVLLETVGFFGILIFALFHHPLEIRIYPPSPLPPPFFCR